MKFTTTYPEVVERAREAIRSERAASELVEFILSDAYINAIVTAQIDLAFSSKISIDDILKTAIENFEDILRSAIELAESKGRLNERILLDEYPEFIDRPYRSYDEAVELYRANLSDIRSFELNITPELFKKYEGNEDAETVIKYEMSDVFMDAIRYSDLPPMEAIKTRLYDELEKNI